MSRHLTVTIAVILAISLLSGCLRAPIQPPFGSFTFYSSPLDADFDRTDAGNRTGEASSHSVLGLFAWGDSSVESAMEEGRLGEAFYADYDYLNILGLYQKYTIAVTGN